MVKKVIVLVIVLFISLSFSYKKQVMSSSNLILWSSDKKLTWDDFLCAPPPKSKFAAVSSLDIRYKAWTRKDTLFVSLASKFFRSNSWVYPKSKSSRLLGHEQTHFDILELYCRKLRQYISKTPVKKSEYKKTITDAYNVYYKQYKTYDSLYDQETDFSTRILVQNRWTEKVNKELLDMEQYNDTMMKILLKW